MHFSVCMEFKRCLNQTTDRLPVRRSREAYQRPTLTKSRDVIIAVDNDHSDCDHYDYSRSE